MVSEMAKGSQGFGSSAEGIFVSVEVEYRGGLLFCGWTYLRFIWAGRAAQDWQWRWAMVPGIGWLFWGEELIEEIQSPYCCSGFVLVDWTARGN